MNSPRSTSVMVLSYHCILMMSSCLESSTHQTTVTLQEGINKFRSWSCTDIYTLSKAKCKYMVVSWESYPPHNQHYSWKATLWIMWSSSILVFSIHVIFLGVSMSSQFAVRRGRFVDYCTLKPILQQNSCSTLYISLRLGIISDSTMPPSTWRRTNLHLNVQKPACCMATISWASRYQDIFNLPSLECWKLKTRLCLINV